MHPCAHARVCARTHATTRGLTLCNTQRNATQRTHTHLHAHARAHARAYHQLTQALKHASTYSRNKNTYWLLSFFFKALARSGKREPLPPPVVVNRRPRRCRMETTAANQSRRRRRETDSCTQLVHTWAKIDFFLFFPFLWIINVRNTWIAIWLEETRRCSKQSASVTNNALFCCLVSVFSLPQLEEAKGNMYSPPVISLLISCFLFALICSAHSQHRLIKLR